MIAPAPSAAQRDRFVADARAAAVRMVSAVRTDSPAVVWEHLAGLSPSQLVGLTIVLAAMVPDTRTARELLEWVEGI